MGVFRANAGGAENRHRPVDRGERIESLDELAHYAQNPPRIRACKIDAWAGLLQELFVFGDGGGISYCVVDDAGRSGASARPL